MEDTTCLYAVPGVRKRYRERVSLCPGLRPVTRVAYHGTRCDHALNSAVCRAPCTMPYRAASLMGFQTRDDVGITLPYCAAPWTAWQWVCAVGSHLAWGQLQHVDPIHELRVRHSGKGKAL